MIKKEAVSFDLACRQVQGINIYHALTQLDLSLGQLKLTRPDYIDKACTVTDIILFAIDINTL